jgi:hypothetical protein
MYRHEPREDGMVGQVAHVREKDVGAVVRHLDKLVTNGPRDLDIASAMSDYGYDAVKWAEGQGVLAELVSSDRFVATSLAMAADWYAEGASAAQCALAAKPQLLEKLGMT